MSARSQPATSTWVTDAAGGAPRRPPMPAWFLDALVGPGTADRPAATAQRPPARFRLPAAHDPEPEAARMVGMCAWAAVLGLLGLAVAARALIAIVGQHAPGWFEPTVIPLGLLGIALTASAFMAVQCRRLPWLMLTAATIPLLINMVLVAAL